MTTSFPERSAVSANRNTISSITEQDRSKDFKSARFLLGLAGLELIEDVINLPDYPRKLILGTALLNVVGIETVSEVKDPFTGRRLNLTKTKSRPGVYMGKDAGTNDHVLFLRTPDNTKLEVRADLDNLAKFVNEDGLIPNEDYSNSRKLFSFAETLPDGEMLGYSIIRNGKVEQIQVNSESEKTSITPVLDASTMLASVEMLQICRKHVFSE